MDVKWILGVLVISLFILTGCSQETNSPFTGIEIEDIPDLTKASVVEEFKGTSENWAAVYYIHQINNSTQYEKRFYLKYIGKGSAPNGEIKYDYDLGGSDVGSGAITFKDAPEEGIYTLLLTSQKSDAVPDQNAAMQLHISWNGDMHSEYLQLAASTE